MDIRQRKRKKKEEKRRNQQYAVEKGVYVSARESLAPSGKGGCGQPEESEGRSGEGSRWPDDEITTGTNVTRVVRQENERTAARRVVAAVQRAAGFPLLRACTGASIRFQIGARSVHATLPSASNRHAWITKRERERYV